MFHSHPHGDINTWNQTVVNLKQWLQKKQRCCPHMYHHFEYFCEDSHPWLKASVPDTRTSKAIFQRENIVCTIMSFFCFVAEAPLNTIWGLMLLLLQIIKEEHFQPNELKPRVTTLTVTVVCEVFWMRAEWPWNVQLTRTQAMLCVEWTVLSLEFGAELILCVSAGWVLCVTSWTFLNNDKEQ